MHQESGPWKVVLDRLWHDILELAYASSFRKRMTYVTARVGLNVTQKDVPDTLLASKHWLRFLKRIATRQIKATGKLSNNSPVTALLVSESALLVLLVVFLVCLDHESSSGVLTRATQINSRGVLLTSHSQ